jgi:hypothetical protein
VIFGVVLHATPVGRSIFAMGASAEAARFAGIRVKRIKTILFMVSGLVCSLAGVLWTFRLDTAVQNNGLGLELDVVAIVLLGGVSIFGGKGSIIGVCSRCSPSRASRTRCCSRTSTRKRPGSSPARCCSCPSSAGTRRLFPADLASGSPSGPAAPGHPGADPSQIPPTGSSAVTRRLTPAVNHLRRRAAPAGFSQSELKGFKYETETDGRG